MRPATPIAGKEDKEPSSAESGKILQNPQPLRNKEGGVGGKVQKTSQQSVERVLKRNT